MRGKLTKGFLLFLIVLGGISCWFIADGTIPMDSETQSIVIGYGGLFGAGFLFRFVWRLPTST